MCGIVGVIQKDSTNISEILINSLYKLEYRGYDSLGIAVLTERGVLIEKDQGKINEVVKKIDTSTIKGKIGIGHTRWATHGPPTKINAHPHTDCKDKIAVIHNGIIENFHEIKKELHEKGHDFKSETDTEIIPHLIEEFIEREGFSFRNALIKTIERLEGTFALCVISSLVPNSIFCVKRDSPLVIGVNSDRMFIASDIPAFLKHTQQVVLLHDNEFVEVTAQKYKIMDLKNKKEIHREPYTVSWKPTQAMKSGYPHHMLKEIHEQPNSLSDYIRFKQESVTNIAESIFDAEKIFFIAAGTAYYSTLTGQNLVRTYAKKMCQSVIASEFDSVLSLVDEDTVIIPVSQSGETMDTIMAIKEAKKRGASILSAVNVVGSTITRYSDEVVYLRAGPEIGVAATKTYLAQTAAMWDIGLELGKITGSLDSSVYSKYRKVFTELPQSISETITRNEIKTKQIADWFATKDSGFYLARGINVQTANEGALKMKEISYIHCESYPAGESKHGPIALIEENYPVVFVTPKDQTYRKIQGNIMEMNARGAKTIAVVEEGDKEITELVDWKLEIPKGYSKALSTLTYVVPLQLLAYYTAVKRGYSPDKPRNLAKSVTVL